MNLDQPVVSQQPVNHCLCLHSKTRGGILLSLLHQGDGWGRQTHLKYQLIFDCPCCPALELACGENAMPPFICSTAFADVRYFCKCSALRQTRTQFPRGRQQKEEWNHWIAVKKWHVNIIEIILYKACILVPKRNFSHLRWFFSSFSRSFHHSWPPVFYYHPRSTLMKWVLPKAIIANKA